MSKKNVVIFGETGSGKSSTINLLMGREVARISDSAIGCTFNFEKYSTSSYNLYDTVGLSEGSKGTMSQSSATSQLINLLRSLKDGISLLIFVMQKGRIKKSLEENYKLFANVICNGKVPVILLITHCEMEMELGTWWRENRHHFNNYGMTFKSVISGCCMSSNSAPPLMRHGIKSLNDSTQSKLSQAIQSNMLSSGYLLSQPNNNPIAHAQPMPLFSLFAMLFAGTGLDLEDLRLRRRLQDFFVEQGYSSDAARQMARDITNSL